MATNVRQTRAKTDLQARGLRRGELSIRAKIGALVLLGMTGMAVALSLLMVSTANTLFADQAHAELTHQNETVAADIEALTERAAKDITLARQNAVFNQYYLAQDDAARQTALRGIESAILYLQNRYTVDEICVINRAGAEDARCVKGRLAGKDDLSPNEKDNPFYAPTLALSDGEVYRSPTPYISPDTHEWVVAHATPLVLPDGTKAGILHFEIPLTWFAAKVNSGGLRGGYSFLMDRDGKLLVHPTFGLALDASVADSPTAADEDIPTAVAVGSPSFQALVRQMRGGQVGRGSYQDKRDHYDVAYQPVFDGNWVVATVLPHAAIASPVQNLLSRTALVAVPLLLLTLALMLWYSARWLTPLLAAVRRQSEAQFRALVQHSSDIIAVLSIDSEVKYISPSVTSVLGYTPEELTGLNVLKTIHADDVAMAEAGLQQSIAQPGRHPSYPVRLRHRDGTWRHIEVVTTNLLHEPGVEGVVINGRDVTDRKSLEDRLEHQAFYDGLTGLPNRALFIDRLGQALAAAGQRAGGVAVLFLDLDGFKVVNDSLGHAAGDVLLVEVARRLSDCLRRGDTVARFGGDEFTMLVQDNEGQAGALSIAQRVLTTLRAPITIDGRELVVSTSIGIALSTADAPDVQRDELLRAADIALYQAKGAGKDCAMVFDPTMQMEAMHRLDLEADMRLALERGEFEVYYQPEIAPETSAVTGMEALVRWQHPLRGLISPAEFIPLAEETGLILPLGEWVLSEACRQASVWQQQQPKRSLMLSVNLSTRQFAQPDLVNRVAHILARTGLPARQLRLEITESVLMTDSPATAAMLQALKALGVSLAIDDFGTGYSSLSYLQHFPVETVKIDKSFVMALMHDAGAKAIIQSVTTLAHMLGMKVTAEGIETAEQLEFVRAAGCDRGQGYYFARPLTATDMSALLEPEPLAKSA